MRSLRRWTMAVRPIPRSTPASLSIIPLGRRRPLGSSAATERAAAERVSTARRAARVNGRVHRSDVWAHGARALRKAEICRSPMDRAHPTLLLRARVSARGPPLLDKKTSRVRKTRRALCRKFDITPRTRVIFIASTFILLLRNKRSLRRARCCRIATATVWLDLFIYPKTHSPNVRRTPPPPPPIWPRDTEILGASRARRSPDILMKRRDRPKARCASWSPGSDLLEVSPTIRRVILSAIAKISTPRWRTLLVPAWSEGHPRAPI